MAFGDTVVENYNLSAAVAVFNDVPTVGWWTFDILIGYTDGHALQTTAGTLTLDAMKGESGGATGYSEGGSAEVIFKAAGKTGVHYTTPLRYYSGTPYATLTLLSSNASDTSVEVSVTPRRVEVDTRNGSIFDLLENVADAIIQATAEAVWAFTVRTLSAGAITEDTFDGETAFPLTGPLIVTPSNPLRDSNTGLALGDLSIEASGDDYLITTNAGVFMSDSEGIAIVNQMLYIATTEGAGWVRILSRDANTQLTVSAPTFYVTEPVPIITQDMGGTIGIDQRNAELSAEAAVTDNLATLQAGLATSTALSTFTNKCHFTGNRILSLSQPTGSSIANEDVFRFDVTLEAAEPYIDGESTDVDDTHILDATIRVTTYQASLIGTQWQLTVTTVSDDPAGNPNVTFSSSNESVATVDESGFVSYMGEGTCEITCESPETETSPAYKVVVPITNTSETTGYGVSTTYIPDAFDAAKHVLILFNPDVADSVTLKDYYLANRPGMATANALGITGFGDVTATNAAGRTSIVSQVHTWLNANSGKPIRYIIVMRGLPSRTTDTSNSYAGVSWSLSTLPYDLGVTGRTAAGAGARYQNCFNSPLAAYTAAQFPGALLVSYLDCGSYAATTAYVAKLKAFAELNGGAGYDSTDGTISAMDAGYGADTWVLDDTYASESYWPQMLSRRTALLATGIDEANIEYQAAGTGTPITAAADVTAFSNWGVHTPFAATWPLTSVSFSGNSNWFLLATIESYNGIYGGSQADPIEFFAATAFGGTAYSRTPAFFAGHTQEPTLFGVNNSLYQSLWADGYTGLEAAIKSSISITPFIAVGDPLVRR